jgi:hypothetical protein
MKTQGVVTARALHRAHETVLEDLRQLERAVQPAAGSKPVDLGARLASTQEHLTRHFRFEEQDGYMDAVRKREPRFERTIQQLAEEHRQLTKTLGALIGEAKGSTLAHGSLRDRVRAWIEAVRRHETCENDLVQEAFNMDVGTED